MKTGELALATQTRAETLRDVERLPVIRHGRSLDIGMPAIGHGDDHARPGAAAGHVGAA